MQISPTFFTLLALTVSVSLSAQADNHSKEEPAAPTAQAEEQSDAVENQATNQTEIADQEEIQVPRDRVIASINGENVTFEEFVLYYSDASEDLRKEGFDSAYNQILENVLRNRILAQFGRKNQIELSDAYKTKLEVFNARQELTRKRFEIDTIAELYLADIFAQGVTEERINAVYEDIKAELDGQIETRARHILVASEEEAKTLIAKTQEEGADFAKLAEKHSTGPSAPNGGDLGYFTDGQMVPAFEKAVSEIEIGGIGTVPVQTQFGWHLIKVEDRRERTVPEISALRQQIVSIIQRDIFDELISKAASNADVTLYSYETGELIDQSNASEEGPAADGEKAQEEGKAEE